MTIPIDRPIFCLTSDVDWASDFAIGSFVDVAARYGIRPTIFATHRSPMIDLLESRGAVELGIHPNFLPGSSHGDRYMDVIDHMLGAFPQARGFRSHCFFDNALITQEMAKRGLQYDSNLCLYLQAELVPLCHASGLMRLPVFWEDDVHWLRTGGAWKLDKIFDQFITPGLKILNFHPFFVAANVPNQEHYINVKTKNRSLDAENYSQFRFDGAGTGTFLVELLQALTARGEKFMSLDEIHRQFSNDSPST